MKKRLFILFIALCLSLASFAQDNKLDTLKLTYNDNYGERQNLKIPFEGDKVMFTQVVNLENHDAKSIYTKAKIAIADMFRSSKDVTQLDDAENRIIILKGWTDWLRDPDPDMMFTQGFKVWFTLKIECKDGRYKMSVYGFSSEDSSSYKGMLITVGGSEKECFENGIRKDHKIKSTIYGLSWLAWRDVADSNFSTISKSIQTATLDTNDDW